MPTSIKTLLLRPMHTGAGGFARIQRENRHLLIRVHARGVPAGEIRLFLLTQSGLREAASAPAAPTGDVTLDAEWLVPPEGERCLRALVVIAGDAPPKPLLAAACYAPQDLLLAKNAALALCERLRPPEHEPQLEPVAQPEPVVEPDPLPPQEEDAPPPRRGARSVCALPMLRWPAGFDSLRRYFDLSLPCRVFDLPGWRFVYAAHAGGPDGLWVGVKVTDARVRAVAYAIRGDAPPGPGPFRPRRGVDGLVYQVLWQSV